MTDEINDNYGDEKIVAYIDVLGFKEILKSRRDNFGVADYFREVVRILKDLKEVEAKKKIDYVLISDAIVLTFPYGDNLENLNEFFIALGRLQSTLCEMDIWLRGAITIGYIKICQNGGNKIVFGPALVRTYQLESKVAKYPRIIVDTEVFKKINLTRKELEVKLSELNKNSTYFEKILYTQEQKITARLPIQDAVWINYLEPLLKAPKIDFFIQVLKANLYDKHEYFEKYKWVQNYALSYKNNSYEDQRCNPFFS